ncbi:hypothetical protein AAMO2058_001191900, partial [Amorphochlora amoebiformis]
MAAAEIKMSGFVVGVGSVGLGNCLASPRDKGIVSVIGASEVALLTLQRQKDKSIHLVSKHRFSLKRPIAQAWSCDAHILAIASAKHVHIYQTKYLTQ